MCSLCCVHTWNMAYLFCFTTPQLVFAAVCLVVWYVVSSTSDPPPAFRSFLVRKVTPEQAITGMSCMQCMRKGRRGKLVQGAVHQSMHDLQQTFGSVLESRTKISSPRKNPALQEFCATQLNANRAMVHYLRIMLESTSYSPTKPR